MRQNNKILQIFLFQHTIFVCVTVDNILLFVVKYTEAGLRFKIPTVRIYIRFGIDFKICRRGDKFGKCIACIELR